MLVYVLLFVSVLMFALSGATFFAYKSKKRTAYLIGTIAAIFGGAYFLLGTLVFCFSPSSLLLVPFLGLAMAAVEVVTIKKTLVFIHPSPSRVTKVEKTGFSVEAGESYLIEGEKLSKAFGLLKQQCAGGTPSLCITSIPPAQAKRRYGLEKMRMIWLSTQEVKDAISPADLDILRDTILEFVKRKKGGVVFLEGVEQLIATNGFNLTLKFLTDICEGISLHRAVLIVPLDPRAVEKRQLATLEQRMMVEKCSDQN